MKSEKENITNDEEFDGLDIAFVIDSTGSMSSYINEAKNSIKEIIDSTLKDLKETFPKNYNEKLKFSIVAYRDHPPQENTFVTDKLDFTTSEKAIDYLNNLSAQGGGDFPEAALDGLNVGINEISWREKADKMLFLILDASPHGIRFGTGYECPCNLHEKNFLPELVRKKIKFFIIKAPNVSGIDLMIKEFEKYTEISVKEFACTEINNGYTKTSMLKSKNEKLDIRLESKRTLIVNKDSNKKSAMIDYISSNVNRNIKKQIESSKFK